MSGEGGGYDEGHSNGKVFRFATSTGELLFDDAGRTGRFFFVVFISFHFLSYLVLALLLGHR